MNAINQMIAVLQAMVAGLPLLPLALFSVLAFWKFNSLLFMITAGVSLMVGLYWYDAYTNVTGLSISLMVIGYALVCIVFAFVLLFQIGGENE